LAEARAFYVNSIPFTVIKNKYFKEAVAAVIEVGPGYKPPGRRSISEALLANESFQCKLQTRQLQGSAEYNWRNASQ